MKKITQLAIAFVLSIGTALAADVQLGAGDVVKISVYGNPDLSLETRISEAGRITYPLIGEVVVGGLSAGAAEKTIAGLLEKGGFLRNPQVSMIVSVMQSQQLSVLGQVNRPGRYPVDGKRRLTDMLALAGGVNQEAADSVTLIRQRDGATVRERVDLIDIMGSSEAGVNPELAAGDVVFVERAPKFYIYGEVQRPGAYRLERGMIVLQALSQGGGLSQRGTERGLRIKRRDASGALQVIDARQDDLVQVDDVVYVRESLF